MTEFEEIPLSFEVDHEILMHREVHFGGSFPLMIQYYEKHGKGVNPNFELKQIQALAEIEKESEQNLAAMVLTAAEAERVHKAKEAYQNLKELYEKDEYKGSITLLIADLILTEEEEPKNEMEAIIAEQDEIVPALLELLQADDFFDPLFPGYGQAPYLAAKCLGEIGDKRAIIKLFETVHERDFFDDDIAFKALKAIGKPAKEFLLKVLHGTPYNSDNERAAIALIQFKDDEEVATNCLQLLQQVNVRKEPIFATYLAFVCEGLQNPKDRKQFSDLVNDPDTPDQLKNDIKSIARGFD